jgi:hypothetical protein
MAALLRLAAMLVSSTASFLRMHRSRLPGECHAAEASEMPPSAKAGSLKKENEPSAPTSQTALAINYPRHESFPGKRSASPECRFEKPWDQHENARSPTGSNRDSRNAALRALPENQDAWCWNHPGKRL